MEPVKTAEFRTAAATVRARLERDLRDAEEALRMAKWRLQQFDRAVDGSARPSAPAPRIYRTGFTKAVIQAAITFEGADFTPRQLLDRIDECFPAGKILFRGDVARVTKTLNKMLTIPGCRIVKLSEGAGLKPPRFQLPVAAVKTPALVHQQQSARMLPD